MDESPGCVALNCLLTVGSLCRNKILTLAFFLFRRWDFRISSESYRSWQAEKLDELRDLDIFVSWIRIACP